MLNSIMVFLGILYLFKEVFIVVECGNNKGISELYFKIFKMVVFKYGKLGLLVSLGWCFCFMMLLSFW